MQSLAIGQSLQNFVPWWYAILNYLNIRKWPLSRKNGPLLRENGLSWGKMAPSRGKMGLSRGKMGLLSRMGLPSRKTDILGWASPQVEKTLVSPIKPSNLGRFSRHRPVILKPELFGEGLFFWASNYDRALKWMNPETSDHPITIKMTAKWSFSPFCHRCRSTPTAIHCTDPLAGIDCCNSGKKRYNQMIVFFRREKRSSHNAHGKRIDIFVNKKQYR